MNGRPENTEYIPGGFAVDGGPPGFRVGAAAGARLPACRVSPRRRENDRRTEFFLDDPGNYVYYVYKYA